MKKAALSALVIASLLALFFGWSLYKTINAPARTQVVSPQGGYLIESVTVFDPLEILSGLIVPFSEWGQMSYLRIIDRQDPSKVYRTPMFATSYTDFSLRSEDSRYLDAIVWVKFDKQEQRFIIGMPDWRPNWRNIFISNTPYKADGDFTPCMERLSPEERALGFGGKWLSRLRAFTMVTPCSANR